MVAPRSPLAKPVSPVMREPDLYVPRPSRIKAISKLTEHESLFDMVMLDGQPLGHAPGQFVQVSVLGVGEAPISIASSPTRPQNFQLCIRNVGSLTNIIHKMKEGEILGIRGPLGHGFDVDVLHGRDLLIIAGGLGIAPLRSLIHYILDERDRFGEFCLLYGAREPKDLLFKDDIALWREDDSVHFHVTVDHPDEQWRGKTGVVTTLFRTLPKMDPASTKAIIVGPPVMFRHVVLEVLARGIPQSSVYCSLERRMECGIGKCGHCQANDVYVCLDGPVFEYGRLKAMREAVE